MLAREPFCILTISPDLIYVYKEGPNMKTINCKIALSGMSSQNFSEKIMIYAPLESCQTSLSFKECKEKRIYHVSDLITWVIKSSPNLHSFIGDWGMENFCYQNIYIKDNERLLGLKDDKLLIDIFNFFNIDTLDFVYIVVAGGASIHCGGYKYVVHSDEYIHQNDPPHVHVIRDDKSVRYYLEPIKRFTQDRPSREHLRDEKKTIIPAIKRNRKKLLEYWNLAVNGYVPPAEDETGRQYYKES